MNNNRILKKITGVVGLIFVFSFSSVSNADGIVDCSNGELSPLYTTNICPSLQLYANGLLNTEAKVPDPVLMIQPLNMQNYRLNGVNAIVESSKSQNIVTPVGSASTTNAPSQDSGSWYLGSP